MGYAFTDPIEQRDFSRMRKWQKISYLQSALECAVRRGSGSDDAKNLAIWLMESCGSNPWFRYRVPEQIYGARAVSSVDWSLPKSASWEYRWQALIRDICSQQEKRHAA
jgi:hypothetical protein